MTVPLALAGLAVYTIVAHGVAFVAISRLRLRIGRMEEVFRHIGVQFGEDKE